jgi:hypothetical protein
VAWYAPNVLRGLKIYNSAPAIRYNCLELVCVDISTEATLCIVSKICLKCSGPGGTKCSAQNQGTRAALQTAIAALSSFQRREGGKFQRNKKEGPECSTSRQTLFSHAKQNERALANIHSDLQRTAPEEAILGANSPSRQSPHIAPKLTIIPDSMNIQGPPQI